MSAQNTNGTTENVTMEQILAAINGVNTKIDTMQKDIDSMKEDMINLKKRQNDTDERFEKMESVINEAVEEEKSSDRSAPAAKETIKDKIKGNLKFIIPAGVVLTAAGGALAYAIYKNKNASVDVIDDVDGGDVIDM
jgi:uncharacterized phage infection (PIP) family protein YhgE|uniref:Outer capsid protein sigma-1 attachment protein n=1 Tax=Myoviridae sp. ctcyQ27 TaxID=2825139 RepID=A0A8S5UF89_9CAUD|nr:MAG TPA: outer capsid protein sigma-1 attachment protein [Myoviridae sp. ctcyQ27]